MTDPLALDVAALERDRARYLALLEQADEQIAAWNERADHIQTAIDGLDRLLAFAPGDLGADGGRPRVAAAPRKAAPAPVAAPAPAKKAPAGAKPAPAAKPAAKKAPAQAAAPAPAKKAADPAAPKGADAIKAVLAGDPAKAFTLQQLLDELGSRGWLGESKRPEEGVRIALKRLTERGGAERAGDGLWRLADPAAPKPAAPEPVPVVVDEVQPEPEAPPEPEPEPTPPSPPAEAKVEPTEAKVEVATLSPGGKPPVTPVGAHALWRNP